VFGIVQDTVSYCGFRLLFLAKKEEKAAYQNKKKLIPVCKLLEMFCFAPGTGNTKSCKKLYLRAQFTAISSVQGLTEKVDRIPVCWQKSCQSSNRVLCDCDDIPLPK